jgi:hypothetical protein
MRLQYTINNGLASFHPPGKAFVLDRYVEWNIQWIRRDKTMTNPLSYEIIYLAILIHL